MKNKKIIKMMLGVNRIYTLPITIILTLVVGSIKFWKKEPIKKILIEALIYKINKLKKEKNKLICW